jgi:hypothetical protein
LTIDFKGNHAGSLPLWLADYRMAIGIKFTAVVANAAFDTFVLNDGVRLFLLPDNGILGALA